MNLIVYSYQLEQSSLERFIRKHVYSNIHHLLLKSRVDISYNLAIIITATSSVHLIYFVLNHFYHFYEYSLLSLSTLDHIQIF
jgi:hypothetical protein